MTYRPDPISPPRSLLKRPQFSIGRFFVIVLWVGFGSALAALVASLIGGVQYQFIGASVFGLLIVLAIGAALWEIAQRHRSSAILAYLEQATRLNLPLPALLRSAEQSEHGATREAINRVRTHLECGETIHDAVATALPALPSRTLGLIGSAERTGRLPQMLCRLMRRRHANAAPSNGASLYLQWYPLMLAGVIVLVVSAISVLVLPKLFQLFEESGVAPPWQTTILSQAGHLFIHPIVLTAAVAALLICVVFAFIGLLPSSIARELLHGLRDWLKWYIPGSAGTTRWRALADACEVMADAMEVGRPLDWAATEASRSGTNRVLAERFAVWADHVRAGTPAIEGARRANMPPLLVGLLRTGAGVEMPALLRFLARYYESRFARSRIVIEALLVPSVAIVMGGVVVCIVYSMFVALMQLVDTLMLTSGGFR
jgi:type II secretory pathway component PulF